MDFTLAEVVRVVGGNRRTLQLWADGRVLRALPGTEQGGSGVHRRFSRDEVVIACIVHGFARDQQISIGSLRRMADLLRDTYDNPPQLRGWIEAAITNKNALFVIFRNTGEPDNSYSFKFFQRGDPNSDAHNFKDIVEDAAAHLKNRGSFSWMLMANPYLRGLP